MQMLEMFLLIPKWASIFNQEMFKSIYSLLKF